jgi:phosphate transport system substrate-binding protein
MLFNNDKAVSPIVATLVLIVVAIAGAAAVGTIMGSFSSDVSDSASADQAAASSSTELLIAGSTTVQPVSELLAEAYMDEHPGVKVTVQGGGSGAGVSSTGMDIVDIGSASRAVKDTELEKYPDIETHQIGGSAVVVIANTNLGISGSLSADDLQGIYNDTYTASDITNITTNFTAYQRAEESGTEDTFVEFIQKTIGNDSFEISDDISGKTGNAGVLEAVQNDDDGLGFVDFGYADDADKIQIVGLVVDGVDYEEDDITGSNIKKELAAEGTSNEDEYYPHGLTRPLNYLTNGNPSSLESSFIDFAMSPASSEYFEDVGYFPITAFA